MLAAASPHGRQRSRPPCRGILCTMYRTPFQLLSPRVSSLGSDLRAFGEPCVWALVGPLAAGGESVAAVGVGSTEAG